MQAERYFGTYARFDTKSKKDAATLLGADNLVGDCFDIEFQREEGTNVAWIRNRFGALIGYFDADVSRQLSILNAREWKLQALLSFVAYTDEPAPGHYWGETAIICYEPNLQPELDVFISGVASRLENGIRPAIDLGEQAVESIMQNKGNWQPKQTVPIPKNLDRTVIMKSQRKITEKLIEQSRKGNKGCLIFGWVFLLAIVACIVFAFKSCNGI